MGVVASPVADQKEPQPTTTTSVVPAPTPEGTNANKCISALNVKTQPQNVNEADTFENGELACLKDWSIVSLMQGELIMVRRGGEAGRSR